ncbi:MAG: PIN domain-containing protein [Acidobacteria bacterium]|nr:PIN domain-containing protein [Acidobacteriota bacterium]
MFLKKNRAIGLDTSVFIYHVEENSKYVGLTDRIFTALERPPTRAVTSAITMLELLVRPYRDGSLEEVDAFYALLSTYPRLEWRAVTLQIADQAASFRAEMNLKAPDAIQAATAVASHATGFISNDPVFRRLKNLDVLILDDLIVSGAAENESIDR